MKLVKLPNGYWKDDKEACRKEASKYNSNAEFARNNSGAYSAARINGWLDDICSHMTSVKA